MEAFGRRDDAIKLEALAAEEQWLIIAREYSRTFQRPGNVGLAVLPPNSDWETS
jgi:hypothetical protein